LQVIREQEQQHERDPRKREKDNQHETRHEILPAHRTLLLHATQRICQESETDQRFREAIKIARTDPKGKRFQSLEGAHTTTGSLSDEPEHRSGFLPVGHGVQLVHDLPESLLASFVILRIVGAWLVE
jgi:hypothetical protein